MPPKGRKAKPEVLVEPAPVLQNNCDINELKPRRIMSRRWREAMSCRRSEVGVKAWCPKGI